MSQCLSNAIRSILGCNWSASEDNDNTSGLNITCILVALMLSTQIFYYQKQIKYYLLFLRTSFEENDAKYVQKFQGNPPQSKRCTDFSRCDSHRSHIASNEKLRCEKAWTCNANTPKILKRARANPWLLLCTTQAFCFSFFFFGVCSLVAFCPCRKKRYQKNVGSICWQTKGKNLIKLPAEREKQFSLHGEWIKWKIGVQTNPSFVWY